MPVALPANATASPPEIAIPATTKARTLVIDDEDLILRVMQRVLGPHHDLVCVTAATDALELIARGSQCDAVTTDLVMPGMNGPRLYERLSRAHPEIVTKAVFLSGGAVDGRIAEFLAQVLNPCLHKPFAIDALHAAARGMMNR